MRYSLFPDGIGILTRRGARPLGKTLCLSFPEIRRGSLLIGGEELAVKDGRVNVPLRLLREGENQFILQSDNAAPAKWCLEGIRLEKGTLSPAGMDVTALLLRLYEEQKKHKEAIAELRRSVLYFQSKIDGNCLF